MNTQSQFSSIPPTPQFEPLAEFANIEELPESWRKFRLKNPNFFAIRSEGKASGAPGFYSEWLYLDAEKWSDFDSYLKGQSVPVLLWLRSLLRAVWTRNDADGGCLSALYGMKAIAGLPGLSNEMLASSPLIQGIPLNASLLTNGQFWLQPGKPIVNGVTGEITWLFPSDFQQCIYELMRCRWRAKTCPQCGKYFVAEKTAQTFCSEQCVHMVKINRALNYWHREGNAKRKAKAKESK
jgi:endogenous inhibitor of DNA gyrase (YacG/DUF329 family)